MVTQSTGKKRPTDSRIAIQRKLAEAPKNIAAPSPDAVQQSSTHAWRIGEALWAHDGDAWRRARIINVAPEGEVISSIQVHYKGWDAQYDQWIDVDDSTRVLKKLPITEDMLPTMTKNTDKSVLLDQSMVETDPQVYGPEFDPDDPAKCPSEYWEGCRYCEKSKLDEWDYQCFDLCAFCFQCQFPVHHPHPRESFASRHISYYTRETDTLLQDTFYLDEVVGAGIKKCGFCQEPESMHDRFVDGRPFVKLRSVGAACPYFWSHTSCAKYAPEVFHDVATGQWYNVAKARDRAKSLICAHCKLRGATMGCFEPKCARSYHVACSGLTADDLEEGVIYWCSRHDQIKKKQTEYEDVFECDHCCARIEPPTYYYSCAACKDYFNSFDFCAKCFEEFKGDPTQLHEHPPDGFGRVFLDDCIYIPSTPLSLSPVRKTVKKASVHAKKAKRDANCAVCGDRIVASVSNVCPSCSDVLGCEQPFSGQSVDCITSYGPDQSAVYSLSLTSTILDIHGRAPRWATHCSNDFSGTWIPHVPRWSLLRYTRPGSKVLSNFAGRGTDVIEAWLLDREATGIDVNPRYLEMARGNLAFSFTSDIKDMKIAKDRPRLLEGDARNLRAYFDHDYFDHVLSHPPYHRCIQYSAAIPTDLSRCVSLEEFVASMSAVAHETLRLLKPGSRCTLAIGDNREHRFIVPVVFKTVLAYMEAGFELEEFIVKRQRCCSGTTKGASLAVLFDFLILTHEIVLIFRKPVLASSPVASIFEEAVVSCPDDWQVAGQSFRLFDARFVPDRAVTGTIWTAPFNRALSGFMQERLMARYGQPDSSCVIFRLGDDVDGNCQDGPFRARNESSEDFDSDGLEMEESPDACDVGDYEVRRLKRVKQNRRLLCELGLVPSSRPASTLTAFDDSSSGRTARPCMVLIEPFRISHSNWEAELRRIISLALLESTALTAGDHLIVGAHDIRSSKSYIPIALHLFSAISSHTSATNRLALREVVYGVPAGWTMLPDHLRKAKDEKPMGQSAFEFSGDAYDSLAGRDFEQPAKQLDIVHCTYLVYQIA